MHSGVPQVSVIDLLLFLMFVNDLPDALGALTLLFADDVKVVTRRPQNISLHNSHIIKWGLPINPVEWSYVTIGLDVP